MQSAIVIGRTVRLHKWAPRFAQRSILVLTRNRRGKLVMRYVQPEPTRLRYTPIRRSKMNQTLEKEIAT